MSFDLWLCIAYPLLYIKLIYESDSASGEAAQESRKEHRLCIAE